jgi:hypothetical protein
MQFHSKEGRSSEDVTAEGCERIHTGAFLLAQGIPTSFAADRKCQNAEAEFDSSASPLEYNSMKSKSLRH